MSLPKPAWSHETCPSCVAFSWDFRASMWNSSAPEIQAKCEKIRGWSEVSVTRLTSVSENSVTDSCNYCVTSFSGLSFSSHLSDLLGGQMVRQSRSFLRKLYILNHASSPGCFWSDQLPAMLVHTSCWPARDALVGNGSSKPGRLCPFVVALVWWPRRKYGKMMIKHGIFDDFLTVLLGYPWVSHLTEPDMGGTSGRSRGPPRNIQL